MKGRLGMDQFSIQAMDNELRYWTAIEKILGQSITLHDVRRTLPVDRKLPTGERPFVDEFFNRRAGMPLANMNGQLLPSLKSIALQDYLEYARARLIKGAKTPKYFICADVDGCLGELQYEIVDSLGIRKFENSNLGLSVEKNAADLIRRLENLPDASSAHDRLRSINTETGLPQYLFNRYGPQLEEEYGATADRRIREIFSFVYPSDVADTEATKFLLRMPLRYHVFRTQVWDHDVSALYEKDGHAVRWAQDIIARGGKLIFVTAAPRIHALKVLKHLGIVDALGHDGFQLFSVEDLYEPQSVTDGTYMERDKGTLLLEIAQRQNVDIKNMAMVGDQLKSDVLAPGRAGIEAYLVSGPRDLSGFSASMLLPHDAQ
jgi:FMN phosphatase YigB (HAD superfamily)